MSNVWLGSCSTPGSDHDVSGQYINLFFFASEHYLEAQVGCDSACETLSGVQAGTNGRPTGPSSASAVLSDSESAWPGCGTSQQQFTTGIQDHDYLAALANLS